MEENNDIDFETDNINSFYYTSDKKIMRMDDEFVLSKITEKYPDFNKNSNENILKQVIVVISNDSVLIEGIEKEYGVLPTELFKIIYRNYDFIFNKCFITKVQKTIKNRRYARKAARKVRNGNNRARKTSGNTGKVL